jgi:biotin synthase
MEVSMDKHAAEILGRALEGAPPTRDECVYLLGFDEASPEATFTRGAANDVVRAKTDNTGVLFGQIGLELYPCEADCEFCAFGKSHTGFTDKITLDDETIRQKAHDFTKDGDLYCLWLMTMDKYDADYYLNALKVAREACPPQTLLYTNVGDTDYETFVRMKEAGADGVYHVIRLGEGVYTTISPEKRRETMANAERAGLKLQDCLEPIGTEHGPEELVDHIFETIEKGFDTAGVMKRTPVPGTRFNDEITNARLAQIAAVNALAVTAIEPYPWIPVHEADPISLVSGANSICAETGVNPRDTAADTSRGRGLDVSACRKMLWQTGFRRLARGDGSRVDLTAEYIAACEAAE